MTEFIPVLPTPNCDAMTTGYLSAMEWLISDDIDRSKVKRFARTTLADARADCAKFARENVDDIALFLAAVDRPNDMVFIGYNFFLNRNGHGTGFWDRTSHPSAMELSRAATALRPTDEYLASNGSLKSESM